MKYQLTFALSLLLLNLFSAEFNPNVFSRTEVVDYTEIPGYGSIGWKIVNSEGDFTQNLILKNGKAFLKNTQKNSLLKIERIIDNDLLKQTFSFDYDCGKNGSVVLTIDTLHINRRKIPFLNKTLTGKGSFVLDFKTPTHGDIKVYTDGLQKVSFDSLLFSLQLKGTETSVDLSSISCKAIPDKACRAVESADGTKIRGISLPEKPDYWQTVAAEKLRKYLYLMTGQMLPLFSGENTESGMISLAVISQANRDSVPDNGYTVHSSGAKIRITGKTSYDIVSGVYGLLKRLGVNFVYRSIQDIPVKEFLKFDKFTLAASSPFDLRIHPEYGDYIGMGYTSHRLLGPQMHNCAASSTTLHTNMLLIDPGLYKTHPEYFALQKDGTRLDPLKYRFDKHLCYSNPEVFRLTLLRVKEWMRKLPHTRYFAVSAGDHHRWCVCTGCRKFDKNNGSYSNLFFDFINRLVLETKKEFPDKKLITLAYEETRFSTDMKLDSALVISNALYPPDWTSQSIARAPGNKTGWRRLNQWLNRKDADIHFFDYPANYGSESALCLPFDAMNEKLDFMRKNNVKGIRFCDMTTQFRPVMEAIWGTLFWKADLDVPQAIHKQAARIYGTKAGRCMEEYFTLLYRHVRERNLVQCCEFPTIGFVNEELACKGNSLLRQALNAAETEEQRRLIQREKMVLLYTELNDYNVRNAPLGNDYAAFAHKTAELVKLLAASRRTAFSGRNIQNNNVRDWLPFICGWNTKLRKDWWNDPRIAEMIANPEKQICPLTLEPNQTEHGTGIRISPKAFSGGKYISSYSWQCEPRETVVIQRASSPWSQVRGVFLLNRDQTHAGKMILNGQHNFPAEIKITINGKTAFKGKTNFKKSKNGWSNFSIKLPSGILNPGKNNITIKNNVPDPAPGADYVVGWVLFSSMDLEN